MKTPVLMVHGACATGEVWNSFRSFFEAQGTRVYTPTLRAELRTTILAPPSAGLGKLRLRDYVSELEHETKRIEAVAGYKPAVIGHSMGGLLAQTLAERGCVSAAVLISPTPPVDAHDLKTSLFWFGVRAANALRVAPAAFKADRKTVYRYVYHALPRAAREAAYNRMVYESGPAFADMGRWRIDESKIRVPMLTIAATRDRLVPAKLVRLVAQKYAAIGGEFREYSEHAHWLYSEPAWEKPAADIYNWLRAATRDLTATPSPSPATSNGASRYVAASGAAALASFERK